MSPARNRVTPLGDIVAIPLRGAWTGNRGILHRGREVVRFHASDLWITCALEFRGRWHEQWQPHHFTWLYFHDEAVSFAAGHRPCAECRRDAYNAYRAAWADALGGPEPSAKEINRRLHGERIFRGTHRRRLHELDWAGLPDGAFVIDRRRARARPRRRASRVDPGGLRRSPAPPEARDGHRDHAARDRRRAPRRLSRSCREPPDGSDPELKGCPTGALSGVSRSAAAPGTASPRAPTPGAARRGRARRCAARCRVRGPCPGRPASS